MPDGDIDLNDLEYADHGDGDLLDGAEPLSDDDVELYPLFAEALDPSSPVTVDEAKADWEALFGAQS